MPQLPVSPMDILYAAIMALLLTWLVLGVSKSFQLLFKPVMFDYPEDEVERIIQKCYILFPKTIVPYKGQTFRRGMIVRVTTNRRKVIEGELLGLNNDNMICVMTGRYVVAHDLASVDEMVLLHE